MRDFVVTMSELGERLRAAREEKELSLEQVAGETRIPLNYVEALETEAFDVFTSDLHARGFLRNYAAYLGLDLADILALYERLRGNPGGKRSAAVAPRPVAEQASRSMLGVDVLLGLVVIALLALAGFSVYQRQNVAVVTPTAGPPPTPTVTPMPVLRGHVLHDGRLPEL